MGLQEDLKKPTKKQSIKFAELDRAINQANNDLVSYIQYTNPSYIPSWHQEVIGWYLDKVNSGDILRLIILVPPRHGKSELSSRHFPAYFLGHHPTKDIMLLSYSQSLPSEFGQIGRDQMLSPYYQLLFTARLASGSKSKTKWKTTDGGGYEGMGRGGGIVGKGADLLLGDDLIKDAQEAASLHTRDTTWDWWQGTARNRLNPNGAIVLVMTRRHDDDIIGRIFEQGRLEGKEETAKGLSARNWTVVKMPAIATENEVWMDGVYTRNEGEPLWPERVSLKELKDVWADQGDKYWYTIYQQDTENESTARVTRGLWRTYKKEDIEPQNIIKKITCYDTAETKHVTSAYTGKTTWVQLRGEDRPMALVGAYKKKMDYVELVEQIKKDYMEDQPREIIIEERSNGRALLQTFRHTIRIGDKMVKLPTVSFNEWCKRNKIPSNLSKQERIDMSLPHITHGEVLVPEENSEWKSMFLKEWVSMSDKSMDIIDSTTSGIIYMKGKRKIILW